MSLFLRPIQLYLPKWDVFITFNVMLLTIQGTIALCLSEYPKCQTSLQRSSYQDQLNSYYYILGFLNYTYGTINPPKTGGSTVSDLGGVSPTSYTK